MLPNLYINFVLIEAIYRIDRKIKANEKSIFDLTVQLRTIESLLHVNLF